jgi:hypothetical protein
MNGFEKVNALQARHYGRKMYGAKIRKQNRLIFVCGLFNLP